MATTGRARRKGRIETLPSGSLRVVVYAGVDPVSGKRHFLREIVPAGPKAQNDAERALRRLASAVDEEKNPTTSATVDQLLDKHFELLEIEPTTLSTYQTLCRKHVRPLIGRQKVGGLPREPTVRPAEGFQSPFTVVDAAQGRERVHHG